MGSNTAARSISLRREKKHHFWDLTPFPEAQLTVNKLCAQNDCSQTLNL